MKYSTKQGKEGVKNQGAIRKTKTGKEYVNNDMLCRINNILETHFGTFIIMNYFKRKNEKGKNVFYLQLFGEGGNILVIPRDNVYNKRYPKKAYEIKHLPQEKEIIDLLVEEADKIVEQLNKVNKVKLNKYNKAKNRFIDKLAFIYGTAEHNNNLNKVYKRLTKAYHPDHNPGKDTSNECKEIIKYYKLFIACSKLNDNEEEK